MERYLIYRIGLAILFYAVYFRRCAVADIDPNDLVFYQGVHGKPGVDFPIYSHIPRTTFNCREVETGYYADLDTDCQVFHICNEGTKISFLCPNGTIFQQSDLICDWWFKVNCTSSPGLYEESAEHLRDEIRKKKESRRVTGKNKRVEFVAENNKANNKQQENLKENHSHGSIGQSRTQLRESLRESRRFRGSSEETQIPQETASFVRDSFYSKNSVAAANKFSTGFDSEKSVTQPKSSDDALRTINNGQNSFAEKSFKNKNNNQTTTSPTIKYSNHRSTYSDLKDPKYYSKDDTSTTASNFLRTKTINNGLPFTGTTTGFSNQFVNSVTPSLPKTTTSKPVVYISSAPTVNRGTKKHDSYSTQYPSTEKVQVQSRTFEVEPLQHKSFQYNHSSTDIDSGNYFVRKIPDTDAFEKTLRQLQTKVTTTTPFSVKISKDSWNSKFPTTISSDTQTTTEIISNYFTETTPKPKPFESVTENIITTINNHFSPSTTPDYTTTPKYHVSTPAPFVTATNPTTLKNLPEATFEHVNNMLNTLLDLTNDKQKLDSYEHSRPDLIIPPSVGPQTLHTLAVYFANALDGIGSAPGNDEEETGTENYNESEEISSVLSQSTLSKYNDLFMRKLEEMKESEKETTSDSVTTTEKSVILGSRSKELYSESLKSQSTRTGKSPKESTFNSQLEEFPTKGSSIDEVQTEVSNFGSEQTNNLSNEEVLQTEHSKHGYDPHVRQLAKVFTEALSAYLENPSEFKKDLEKVRPTPPPSTESTTDDDEVLNFSDADINRDPPYPPASPKPTQETATWGFIIALNKNKNRSEVLSNSLQHENLHASDSVYYGPNLNSIGLRNSDDRDKVFTTPLPTTTEQDELSKFNFGSKISSLLNSNDFVNQNIDDVTYTTAAPVAASDLGQFNFGSTLESLLNSTETSHNSISTTPHSAFTHNTNKHYLLETTIADIERLNNIASNLPASYQNDNVPQITPTTESTFSYTGTTAKTYSSYNTPYLVQRPSTPNYITSFNDNLQNHRISNPNQSPFFYSTSIASEYQTSPRSYNFNSANTADPTTTRQPDYFNYDSTTVPPTTRQSNYYNYDSTTVLPTTRQSNYYNYDSTYIPLTTRQSDYINYESTTVAPTTRESAYQYSTAKNEIEGQETTTTPSTTIYETIQNLQSQQNTPLSSESYKKSPDSSYYQNSIVKNLNFDFQKINNLYRVPKKLLPTEEIITEQTTINPTENSRIDSKFKPTTYKPQFIYTTTKPTTIYQVHKFSVLNDDNNSKNSHHEGTDKTTYETSKELPSDHWTASSGATKLLQNTFSVHPLTLNDNFNVSRKAQTTPAYVQSVYKDSDTTQKPVFVSEIQYDLKSLPKVELNATQVHGILIDFMNSTKQTESHKLDRILHKLNTTQEEFLTKMSEIESNPLTRRLILLLISECNKDDSNFVFKPNPLSAQIDRAKDDNNSFRQPESELRRAAGDQDARALDLLNSLYTIAAKYGK